MIEGGGAFYFAGVGSEDRSTQFTPGAVLKTLKFNERYFHNNGICVDFKGQQLVGKSFKGSLLIGSRFEAANLSKADFRGSRLEKAEFYKANLAGADFGPLPRTELSYGLSDFEKKSGSANLGTSKNIDWKEYRDTVLLGADLARADLRGAKFNVSMLSGANLSCTDIRGADFTDADVINTIWAGAFFDSTTKLPFSKQQAQSLGLVDSQAQGASVPTMENCEVKEAPTQGKSFQE